MFYCSNINKDFPLSTNFDWRPKRAAEEEWRKSVGPIVWEMMNVTEGQSGEEYPTNKEGRKTNWVGHIWRNTRYWRKYIVTGRRGRRRKQLLDDRG